MKENVRILLWEEELYFHVSVPCLILWWSHVVGRWLGVKLKKSGQLHSLSNRSYYSADVAWWNAVAASWMECSWCAKSPFHHDSPHNTASNFKHLLREVGGRVEQIGFHVGNKPQSTRQPWEIGDTLLLNQQLWWNCSSQMNLAHLNLILNTNPQLHPNYPLARHNHPSMSMHSIFSCPYLTIEVREFYNNQ